MANGNGAAVLDAPKKAAEPVTLDTLKELAPTQRDVLKEVAAGNVTAEVAFAYFAWKDAESKGKLYCKVARKGGLSVYGLQQMPVTLYIEQWERLLVGAPEDHFVLVFIREWEGKEFHGESAKTKGGPKEEYTAVLKRKGD